MTIFCLFRVKMLRIFILATTFLAGAVIAPNPNQHASLQTALRTVPQAAPRTTTIKSHAVCKAFKLSKFS